MEIHTDRLFANGCIRCVEKKVEIDIYQHKIFEINF